MKKPNLSDYGLKGIDSRPQIDLDNYPASEEEVDRAMQAMLAWFIGNERVGKFRADLREWEWQEHDAGRLP